MAGLAQATISKMHQLYERITPKIPAEITVRNTLIFSSVQCRFLLNFLYLLLKQR